MNCDNIPLETIKEYLHGSLYLPFLEIAFAEMKPRSVKKKGHIMCYACSFKSMMLEILQEFKENSFQYKKDL